MRILPWTLWPQGGGEEPGAGSSPVDSPEDPKKKSEKSPTSSDNHQPRQPASGSDTQPNPKMPQF